MLTEEEKNAGLTGRIIPINIEEQMKSAYIDYSMSVIVSRALPDVRDGMKPVHRRILYDMSAELNLYSDKPTRKSARIVGDVLGKFHPHGDTSVYDAMVRLAQDWSMRYPLVDGQGNFGSMDGDSPAAMRYTEARMKKITDEVMADIDKETVDWTLNFDDTIPEPTDHASTSFSRMIRRSTPQARILGRTICSTTGKINEKATNITTARGMIHPVGLHFRYSDTAKTIATA